MQIWSGSASGVRWGEQGAAVATPSDSPPGPSQVAVYDSVCLSTEAAQVGGSIRIKELQLPLTCGGSLDKALAFRSPNLFKCLGKGE